MHIIEYRVGFNAHYSIQSVGLMHIVVCDSIYVCARGPT
jgi:hypothetical protein